MINAKVFFNDGDEEYITALRRELHMHPELETELPATCGIVKRELEAMGIPYSEEYAQSGIVGYINYDCGNGAGNDGHVYTIGLRADMDALPVTEETGLPYASLNPGKMHACGHDAHTAMLLGAARALKRAEADGAIKYRVKLFFQPNEEGKTEGAALFVKNGALKDVDIIFGQHVSNDIPAGKLAYREGPAQAACYAYTIVFKGLAVHATVPQEGHDALCMAVKAVNDIYLMNSREIDPFKPHIISVGSLHAGTAHNIIADRAEIQLTFRFYDDDVKDIVDRRIREICENAARELSGSVSVDLQISADPLINDAYAVSKAVEAQKLIVGEENVVVSGLRMGSEDFSFYLKECPGCFSRIGTGNPLKGCTGSAHSSAFMIDEDVLLTGAQYLAQLALLDY